MPTLPPAEHDDILRCAALCEAALRLEDEQSIKVLGDIARALVGGVDGGFFPAGQEVPEAFTLRAPIVEGDDVFGWFAFAGSARYADRLIALGQLTGRVFREREKLWRQRLILDHIQDSVITMDLAGFITGWNKGAEKLFGYTSEEAVGQNVLFLYADEATDDFLPHDGFLEGGGREMEVLRRRKSGEVFWAALTLSLVRDEQGNPTELIGYLADITERLESEQKLRLHARIFENSEEAIMITNAQERIVSVNSAFCRITGYTAAEVVGQTPRLFKSDRHDRLFYEAMWAGIATSGRWQGEVWDTRKNGEVFPMWTSVAGVRDAQGEITHYFAICSDITERKRSEEQIHFMAYYDALTGLPNRALLFQLVDQALNESHRSKAPGALLFVDLNRFKPINDTLGHDAGDQLLKEIGKRFRHLLRKSDVVARLGGDEFVVALFDILSRDHPGVVAEKLLHALDVPFDIHGHELRLGASIGISLYPDDAKDTDTLLRYADIAMYRSKQTGDSGYKYFSHDMNQRSLERLTIETGIKRALERGELLLYYQPKVDLLSGHIVGAEALVRWKHPERGMVPPGEFIPVAEETGLIIRIGDWVLEAACAQAQAWMQSGLPTTKIAVNLSARQFTPALPAQVAGMLERFGLPPEWLELEITESMLMHSAEAVIALMDELTALGVSLSLDDFGTGYSSLSYLKRFPIETLKIDRSFIAGTPADTSDCAIAGAIISMAKQLNHRTIAEGVETLEQVEFLRGLGCDEIQGYYYSPPVPSEKFEGLVRAGKAYD